MQGLDGSMGVGARIGEGSTGGGAQMPMRCQHKLRRPAEAETWTGSSWFLEL